MPDVRYTRLPYGAALTVGPRAWAFTRPFRSRGVSPRVSPWHPDPVVAWR
jgi:hypothetical protein